MILVTSGRVAIALNLCVLSCSAADAAETTPEPIKASTDRWSITFASSYLWHSIRNPWYDLAGLKNNEINRIRYDLATQLINVNYRLTQPSGWRFLRGYWQGSMGVVFSDILEGPETHYAGVIAGLRYNFVQGSSPLSPFLGLRFGAGWTDSRGIPFSQQQDFCFTYLMDAGLSYRVNSKFRLAVSARNQHISNLYLTNPNYGFDTLGVNVGLEHYF